MSNKSKLKKGELTTGSVKGLRGVNPKKKKNSENNSREQTNSKKDKKK